MEKNQLRLALFNFLGSFGDGIKTKLTNVCNKTGQYNVPSELFQKRTPRSNRVLMPWKAVKNNNLTLEQLNTFEGGVAIEFINDDFFDNSNESFPIFNELKMRIGSNEKVSAIISIRSEDGSSSSQAPRNAFAKLINNTSINYKGEFITINRDNYNSFAISKPGNSGVGNEQWDGFLYVSIRGGQQDTIETHHGKSITVFNPACEYASAKIRIDLDLVVSFFAMKSIDPRTLTPSNQTTYAALMNGLKSYLSLSNYNSDSYTGNLYDYCINHPSVKMIDNQLTDPIQLRQIKISDFADDNRSEDSIDFTHGEAVLFEKYYWDKVNKTILSPARPDNIFWSFHLSNMMQQNFTLEQYFNYEAERYSKRQKLLNR